ncbi:MAG: porin family protein [Bacteroidetes bacterium]|nr:porin family protein [Bacteroidota bacterium]
MLRIVFCSLLFIFYSLFLPAQDFHAGVIAGMTTTQVDGDRLSGFNKAGLVFGGFVNRKLSESTSLQLEIMFIQKGSRKPPTNDDPSLYEIHLNYFEVPVLFKFIVVPKFEFEAGASAAALVFSEEDNENGQLQTLVPFNKIDFCAHAGFNYPFTDHLTFNSRFSYSIVPIRRFYQGYYWADGAQFNNQLTFTLHYQF